MITPIAIESIEYRYYIVYACIGMCIPATVFFLYPKAIERQLEEIDQIFRESPSVLATVRFASKYRSLEEREDETSIREEVKHLERVEN